MKRVFYSENKAGHHKVDWEGTTKELAVFLESNPQLVPLASVDEATKKAARNGAARRARAAEYPPIADQLDAIMKWLATESEFGVPQELKSLAMACMSVKSRHPIEG
jgi:hypothetical protein